jgi:nucleotide-binding universal stress UspA family protein
MKTIIVPTGFSTPTDTAIAYAASLARVTTSSVLLLHVYQMPVNMNDFPLLMIPVDDLRKSADAGLDGAKKEAKIKFADIQFETESRLGNSEEEIEAVAQERATLCIVTSTQKLSGLETFLMGDEALSLMKTCSHPVIAVPEGAAAIAPKNIVLAVDLTHVDEIPVQKIIAIVDALKAHLHIVHVEIDEEEPGLLQNLMKKFAPLEATCHAIKNTGVAEGIKNYLLKSDADLLMLLPHKHNFYERLFFKGHTAEIVNEVSLPVLCINS